MSLAGNGMLRPANRSSHNAPRNVYRTSDDVWVAVSASATSIAERAMRLVGRDDLARQPWFATGAVLAEVGVDDVELERLRSAGVV